VTPDVQEHGLDTEILAVAAACIALWSLTARRLARWNVSSAMAMVVLGFVATNPPLDLIDLSPNSESVQLITELALALVLFSDASRVNLRALRDDPGLPTRLLLIGLPLSIALGFIAATLLTDLDPWLCALAAAALAPTDAALGAPVVADPNVPMRIRRTLNVESGLNDGLATPLVMFFIAGAVAEAGSVNFSASSALADLAVGLLAGVAIGLGGGLLLRFARRLAWTTSTSIAILVPTLALVSYFVALELDANGFVAAFVGGLMFGSTQRDAGEIGEFGEELGEMFGLLVWLIVGAVAVDVLDGVTWGMFALAVLALTVLRMIPVALAVIGSGLDRTTVAFIGWFGPRGLASIVFGIIALDALPAADGQPVVALITLTVVLSVLLHGVTARPLARRYGERTSNRDDGDTEPSIRAGTLRPRHLGEHSDRVAVDLPESGDRLA
jgi:NhaP-type Na+/H+ or K+/H+ antiporter